MKLTWAIALLSATTLVVTGADSAFAATKRVERGPEKVTAGTQAGKKGYWIEYEQSTFEKAAEKVAEIARGRLTAAELTLLLGQIKKLNRSARTAEIEARVKAIIAARPKAPPKKRR